VSTLNTARIESRVANFDEYLGKFVYLSVSNVSKEFPEIDENCDKGFEDVPGILKNYRDQCLMQDIGSRSIVDTRCAAEMGTSQQTGLTI
jgi:hypothetical protein